MNKPRYKVADIMRLASDTSYLKGRKYYQEGRVHSVVFEGSYLLGSVQGKKRYNQRISFHQSRIEGNCSCLVAYNCKHVVAVLLAGLTLETISNYQTRTWLNQMELSINASTLEPVPAIPKDRRLIYILKIKDTIPKVIPFLAILKKSGGYSKSSKACDPYLMISKQPLPEYINFNDNFILHCLAKSKSIYSPNPENGYEIPVMENAAIFDKLLDTGNCYWNSVEGPILSKGPSKQAHFSWKIEGDGTQRITCSTDNQEDHILNLAGPWYLDENQGLCGRLTTQLPDLVAGTLLAAPVLEPLELEPVQKILNRYSKKVQFPIPESFQKIERIKEKPIPHLYLYKDRIYEKFTWYSRQYSDVPLARVSFYYGQTKIGLKEQRDVISFSDQAVLIHYQRDQKAEQEILNQLFEHDFKFIEVYRNRYAINSEIEKDLTICIPYDIDYVDLEIDAAFLEEQWIHFSANTIPELRQQGWIIEFDDSFPYQIQFPDDDWYAEIDESKGNDWFGLELGVTVDGNKMSLIPILLGLVKSLRFSNTKIPPIDEIADDDLWCFPLPNNAKLALPAKRAWQILSFLKDLYDLENSDSGKLSISRFELSNLAEFEATMKAINLRWFGGEKLRELGKQLSEFSGISAVPSPKGLNVSLRHYQQDGLNWLQFLREHKLGGILADDMGLGKTIQALAYMMSEKENKRLTQPILVVAPTSVLSNWQLEIERFAPRLKTLVLHGIERKKHFDAISEYDVVLSTYPLITRDKAALLEKRFHSIILDEAQYIKNPKAKHTQILCQLISDHRICLTGTPIENHLGELWSQFNFLLPGFLGDEKQFRKIFRNPIERQGDKGVQAALVRRIKPFILRRTKNEIATELPPKTLIIKTVSMEKSQADLYETIRVSMQKKVREEIAKKGLSRSHIIVLDALLRLRQTCCDPRLLKMDAAKKVTESAKLEMLMELLPIMVSEGRKILLFSQFVGMLTLIEKELNQAGLPYVKLTGQTKDRKTPVESFQKGDVPIFLISLKAGGTGINLTAADTVIHYDPWWNPAVENQATDRAHRIGQDKPVFIYKLLTKGSIEEKILKLQEKKHALAEGIFCPNSDSAAKLTAEDINALFDPIE